MMMSFSRLSGVFMLLLSAFFMMTACGGDAEQQAREQADEALLDSSWSEIEQQARGGSLTLMMWMGDPLINNYMQEYVVPQLRERYDIELEIVSGQGSQVVSTLMAELESGQAVSQIDQAWINGETFYQLRQIDALFGPFVDLLPNARFVDFDNPFIAFDFQQPTDGYEAPWGNVQFTLIYDEARLSGRPPQTLDAFETWVKANPGQFSIPVEFAGMTLLKSWMISLADDPEVFNGPFDEAVYERYSSALWEQLRRMKPYFWRQGETFPNSLSQLHQLYANGEVAFTMSNNDSEADNKVAQGLFPESSRAYVPESGSIQNSHYMGIPARARNKAEAMVVINFLMSPEAQYEKLKPLVWGDGSVLAREKLPEAWQQRFADIPGRERAPEREAMQENALREPAPEYMIRIFEDFRAEIL